MRGSRCFTETLVADLQLSLDPADHDNVVFSLLGWPAVEALRRQLERDLGVESQDLWVM